MKLLSKPNIPSAAVTLAAVNAAAGECIQKLKELKIEILPVSPLNGFQTAVAGHADLQIIPVSNQCIFASEQMFGLCVEKIRELTNREIQDNPIPLPLPFREHYPDDVPLNAVVVGKHLLCNPKTVSAYVLQAAEALEYTVIKVNQGYTKCAVCVLSENAIITDDLSIYRAAQFFLNDVTYIEKNSVRLKGFDCGFIGGATGLIGKNLLAVNGCIMSHSCHNKIIDALQRNKINAVELHNGQMEDIGSIVPLLEN